MNDDAYFLNRDKAIDLIDSSNDPIEEVLLRIALTKLQLFAIKQASLSKEGSDEVVLPQEPFDLFFYAKVIQELFEPNLRNKIKLILEGDPEARRDMFDDI